MILKRPPFDWLCHDMTAKIEKQRLHYSQKLPGMTPDEVRAEMLECLWKAWQTYRASHGVPIEKWFWRVWMSRKSDLIIFYYRQRRDISKEVLSPFTNDEKAHEANGAVPHDTLTEHGPWFRGTVRGNRLSHEDIIATPEEPTGRPEARRVWVLLASGLTRNDVIATLGISKRAYYDIIKSWRDMGPAIVLGEI